MTQFITFTIAACDNVQVVSHGAPYRHAFLQKLLQNPADGANPEFEQAVIEAIERFLPTIEPVVETLNSLLKEFGLDPTIKSIELPPVVLPSAGASHKTAAAASSAPSEANAELVQQ